VTAEARLSKIDLFMVGIVSVDPDPCGTDGATMTSKPEGVEIVAEGGEPVTASTIGELTEVVTCCRPMDGTSTAAGETLTVGISGESVEWTMRDASAEALSMMAAARASQQL
jgi:hypothetical protein